MFRSVVDESLVHCHGGCELEPRNRTVFFYFIYILIDLFI